MDAELLARNIAAHWVQAGILAASALLAMRLLRLHEPRARLAALHLALVAIVLLPAVQPWRPDEPALQVTLATTAIDLPPITSEAVARAAPSAAPGFEPALAAVALAAAGIVLRLIWLLYGVVRLARFSRAASAAETPDVAWALEAEVGVSARYIHQMGSRGPWTFGFLRPTIALPAGFDALVPAFQRSVICHELVHVKRRDMAVAFCEELAVAALWFHPWIWLLRARIRVAREQVVDGQVVALLGNRDEYVRCLVDISGHDLAPHFSQAGAGMLRPRELRARVDAIFQEVHMSRTRFAVAALSFVAVTAATGRIAIAAMPLRASPLVPAAKSNEPLPLLVSRFLIAEGSATAISWTAAEQPQAAPDAPPRTQINTVYPEYPQDALERGIRGTVIVDITVNPAGEVTTAAVASGPQELRASAFKAALGLKYTKGSSTTALKIAFDYTLTGTSWGVRIGDALGDMGPRFTATRQGAAASADSTADPDETGAYRVGGSFLPPKKLKDVPPEYPEAAKEARVQGVVIMEVRIDERGMVSDVRTLRSIPLLDQAAIDAVKQWQYTPTLMNGVAVPVRMTVTVNFTLRQETPGTNPSELEQQSGRPGAAGSRNLIRIQVTMPDGRTFMSGEVPNDVPVFIDAHGIGKFHFKASLSEASQDVTVSVYDETLRTHVGDVVLTTNAPVAQLPTSPSFGVQLLGVRPRINIQ